MGREIVDALQAAGQDWNARRVNSPVVRMLNGATERYAVLGALVQTADGPYVTGIDFELGSSGGHSSILGPISLEDLVRGEIQMKGGTIFKLEFVGLASDEEHKQRKWTGW